MQTSSSSGATTAKDLFGELKRLEKALKEAQAAGNAYTELTSKLTKKKEKQWTVLPEKEVTKLIRTYRETKLIVAKAERYGRDWNGCPIIIKQIYFIIISSKERL